MRLIHLLITGLLVILLFGCSSLKVTTDFDASQDFSKYKTYRWAKDQEVSPNDDLAKDPLLKKRVISGIDKTLAEKGFELIESGEPDFVILLWGGAKEKMQVTDTGGYRGYGWYDPWWGPYGSGGSTHVSYYEEGSLVIDIVDWQEKELSWRGMGTKTLKEYSSQEEQQIAIDEVVAKILADFPPGGPQHQQ